MDSTLETLYKSPKGVFTNEDLALLWGETKKDNLKSKIAYYIKRGRLIRLSRGIYAKEKTFDARELATSIYFPCYISFETVLRDAGMIFQHYDTIFIAGQRSKTVRVGDAKIAFRKLKDLVLFSPDGVDNKGLYSIATPERAFLDTLYLFPLFTFDNLSRLDWNRCAELVTLYGNRTLEKRLATYRARYA